MADDWTVSHINEPDLAFGHGQVTQYPKDGLMLFGPLADSRGPAEIRVGVLGRKVGLERYQRWVEKIGGYIPAKDREKAHHTAYPGFEAVFDCRWPGKPVCAIEIDDQSIRECLYIADRYQAIYKTVGLFEDAIRKYLREEEAHVDVWFVVIPEEVWKLGRPKSTVPMDERLPSDSSMSLKLAREFQRQMPLFDADRKAAEIYKYEVHFHNQLKARLLDSRVVAQVVRETSLTPEDFVSEGRPLRQVQDPATLAWNLTTTTYFKASGRPWKLANVREGVCYVGIVFKRDMTGMQSGNACCGAQMFLDSGDGLVFKGAVGPWYSEDTREFHISKEKAYELMKLAVDAYQQQHGRAPEELFIHGRKRFDDEEWEGFSEAVPRGTNLVGVRIREDWSMKLYTPGEEPVLRGISLNQSHRKGYLWTRGHIPRLQTYPGREVPNPLTIEVCRGRADLNQVMCDIMGLTKVNFNACIYGDGYPVTLRFADQVGEILTAAPLGDELPPLPFKHYI
ncbi:MAG TPA: hypothetical protein PKJ78_21975 [Candidatus Hydrogenedentes bacterium]|nr:hypothetical protein [Candidatus Hydrogenedentota bacterium]